MQNDSLSFEEDPNNVKLCPKYPDPALIDRRDGAGVLNRINCYFLSLFYYVVNFCILPLAYANCHVRGQLCRFCLLLFCFLFDYLKFNLFAVLPSLWACDWHQQQQRLLMLRSFILYFYFYFHLFVLRASRL